MVTRVNAQLEWRDVLGAVKVRLNIGRMAYAVEPGLYAVGNPEETSPVLVSANYKLSFDYLRRELGGLDVWILVLDTKGVNVWCAAGKGTFGTDELVSRIKAVGLEKIVSHRKVILPQLSAPGIAAHEVKKQSGFQVVYGPVRACDIKAFIHAGMEATPEMRMVRFDFADRLAVVPVEIVEWAPHVFLLGLAMLGLSGITGVSYDLSLIWTRGFNVFMIVLGAFLGGSILVPALLPWLPGKAFSIKSLCVGLVLWGILVSVLNLALDVWAMLPVILSITSFMAMNFTGCTTFTSQSGVKREMRYAIPVQILLLITGMILWVIAGIGGSL
ncbi:MAG: hypothetical protein A2283_23180 [Lentisphaerae bacterium RIFOXYA12_FULL_48_11]|nr:MAG: hypothetical protein A2283_23180 [Lentisphaerae bacterium RIFOXYA12_FULL_48_11]